MCAFDSRLYLDISSLSSEKNRLYVDISSIPNAHLWSVWFVITCDR
jgi:hypothetical protein